MASHIDEIIRLFGYAESSCLKYRRDGFIGVPFTAHTTKVLGELSPYAAYMVNDEPFVLFFDEASVQDIRKQLDKKVWNAQIPVIIVCGTGDVKIFNGCSINKKESLLPEMKRISIDAIDENSPFSYWEITRQTFWDNYTKQFSGERLNDCLLSNLSDITEKLRNLYHVSFATKLMLRLIFIRYLIDRGVDLDYKGFSFDASTSKETLLSLLKDKAKLYALFLHLKDKFNGNLFELENEIDDQNLTEDVLRLLSDFLSANIDTKTRQLSFFDLYDFNIIPVELISNIYEILLGKENRDKDNAFYTPKYLVDYILDYSIDPYVRDNKKCKVLDPSCGSGIFLVESYRRMVEKELNGEQFTEDNKLLQEILTENIYGIDLSKDAIDVAIFSLYLAVLDYKNPKTLKRFKLPPLKGQNLFVCDFFDEVSLLPLQSVSFDFIVGNPPWSNKKGLHVDYCKKKGYLSYLQNNDTCRSFMLRAKDFCRTNTQCCFVLHSKILYMQKQPSKKFREFWLMNTEISRIVELSSVRKHVFKNADAPAVILTYKFSNDNVLDNRFEYISIKPNLFFKLFNIIVVEKNDVKSVQQKLPKENDWVWKTLVYGLSGDIDTIIRIRKSFSTIKQAIENQTPSLIKGTGVKYNDGDQKDAKHLYGRDFLDSNAIDHFSLNMSKLSKFEKSSIDRIRDERLFHAPYCLVLTGIDMSDYTMRAVFSDISFVFREVVYAIKGSYEQRNLLLNLTGLFNSALFSYLNLMLGSFAGIEREKRLVEEVLSFPYVYNDDIADQVAFVQRLILEGNLEGAADVSDQKRKLNQMVFAAFQLTGNEFIDYALHIQIPQLTGVNDNEVYRFVNIRELEEYGKRFYDYLSTAFVASGKYVMVYLYPQIAKHYSVIEVALQDMRPERWVQVIDVANSEMVALTRFSAYKTNDRFYSQKDVLYFEENSFYIIKPNYYKNWHPAIARLDLMEVVDQILSRNGGNK